MIVFAPWFVLISSIVLPIRKWKRLWMRTLKYSAMYDLILLY